MVENAQIQYYLFTNFCEWNENKVIPFVINWCDFFASTFYKPIEM
jgi:hypothetical protein